MPDPSLNLIPIIVAGIVNMALGAFWYSPLAFGKIWLKSMGKAPEDFAGGSIGMIYVFNTIASLIFAYVLAHIIKFAGINSFVQGVMVGFWVWLGFVVTTVLPGYLYESRPKLLYFIFILYQLFFDYDYGRCACDLEMIFPFILLILIFNI